MKSCAYAEWDVGLAAEKARATFTYVARMLPEDAPPCTLEALGAADRAVLEAEEAHDWALPRGPARAVPGRQARSHADEAGGCMRREKRNPTRAEWAAITSRRLVVRRMPPERGFFAWWRRVLRGRS